MLLLDEPTAGMNPQESARFVDFVHRVRDEREVSVLLIEHDMSVVMKVIGAHHRARPGREDRRGRPGRRSGNNPRVIEAYLGRPGRKGAPDDPADTASAPTAGRQGDPMLVVDDISVYYGNIAAVKGLSIKVPQGEIVTLIGSNGAGKSTTLRTISGLLQATHRVDHVRGQGRSAAPRATRSSGAGICQSRRAGASSRG